MSNGRRIPRAKALEEAQAFQQLLLPHQTCEKIEIAGSLRRKTPDVGDFDFVAIPKIGELAVPGDMFGQVETCNLLWARVDDLVTAGTVAKHVKDTKAGPRTKWGDTLRAIEWQGRCVEVYLAKPDNWGVVLAVRTGPEGLSTALVIAIQRYGYRCRESFHVYDINSTPPKLVPCPREEQIFKMSGIPFLPPEER